MEPLGVDSSLGERHGGYLDRLGPGPPAPAGLCRHPESALPGAARPDQGGARAVPARGHCAAGTTSRASTPSGSMRSWPRRRSSPSWSNTLASCRSWNGLLAPNYLLSANLAIKLYPGETRQPLHFDDGFYKVPRPRRPWASARSGPSMRSRGTTARPRSSRGATLGRPAPGRGRPWDRVRDHAGWVGIVFMGTLWHRGGANRSAAPRLAITPQYCEPWLRQIENQGRGPARHDGAVLPRVQELLGYSIHPPSWATSTACIRAGSSIRRARARPDDPGR